MTPRVSVVLPARNRAWCIRESIESVLRQTFTDFELLLVDDASDDDTYAIMQAYATQDRRIRVLSAGTDEERQARIDAEAEAWGYTAGTGGEGPARNLGIAASSGEFYACQDSDDVWEPRHLAVMVNLLDRCPNVVAVSGLGITINRAGKVVRTFRDFIWRGDNVNGGLRAGQPFGHSSWVCRMAVLERVGGYRPMSGMADWDLFLRIAREGKQAQARRFTVRRRFHNDHMARYVPTAERRRTLRWFLSERNLLCHIGWTDAEMDALVIEGADRVRWPLILRFYDKLADCSGSHRAAFWVMSVRWRIGTAAGGVGIKEMLQALTRPRLAWGAALWLLYMPTFLLLTQWVRLRYGRPLEKGWRQNAAR